MLRGSVAPRASALPAGGRKSSRRGNKAVSPAERSETRERQAQRTTAWGARDSAAAAAAAVVLEPRVERVHDGTVSLSTPQRTAPGTSLAHAPKALSSEALRLDVAWGRGERAGVPVDVEEPGASDVDAHAVRRVQRGTQPMPVRGQRLRVRLQRRPPLEGRARRGGALLLDERFQGGQSSAPQRSRSNEHSQNLGHYTVETQSDLLTREEETLLVTRAQAGMALEHTSDELAKELGRQPSVDELAHHTLLPTAVVEERLALGTQAKHLMVKHNLRLVISVARRYAYRGLELSDLIQEGAVGLIRGIQRFDPGKGYKFSTYSHWWIRQAVSRAVIDQGRTVRLPAHIVEMLTRMRRAEQAVQQHGRPDEASAAKVSALLGVTPDRVRQLVAMSRDVSSMDAETTSHSSKDSRRTTVQDGVAASPVAVEEEFDSQFLADDLNAVLNTLEPRERNVLRMHFGLVGNGRAMTLVDVGATYGLSRERVRQIEDIAFRKLRSPQRSKTLLRHIASGLQEPSKPGHGQDVKVK